MYSWKFKDNIYNKFYNEFIIKFVKFKIYHNLLKYQYITPSIEVINHHKQLSGNILRKKDTFTKMYKSAAYWAINMFFDR